MNIENYIKKVYLTDNAIVTTGALLGIWSLSYLGQKKLIDMFKNRRIEKFEKLGNSNNCNTLEENKKIYRCKLYFLTKEHNLNIINLNTNILMTKDSAKVDKKIEKFDKEKYEYEINRMKDKIYAAKNLYNHRVALLKLQYLS